MFKKFWGGVWQNHEIIFKKFEVNSKKTLN